jgi:defect-in-organelle-trafficking protein DotD
MMRASKMQTVKMLSRTALNVAGCFCGFMLLAACESNAPMNPAMLPVRATAVDPDPASLRIAEAAEKATKALNKMAQIEAFRTPMPDDTPLQHPGLDKVTSLTWTGPIDQVTRTLTELAGLNFRVIGTEPPLPLVVSVNAHNQEIGKILRDIGFQAGRRADIILNTATNTVDLRYAPTDGNSNY